MEPTVCSVGFHLIANRIRKICEITECGARHRSRDAAYERRDTQLENRRYLVGDRFGRADLTLAALERHLATTRTPSPQQFDPRGSPEAREHRPWEQSVRRLLSPWRSKLPRWSFQHDASKNLGAFIGGGTRTQFRCNGTGGWRRRRWQWSRWSKRRSRNHRQLKRLAKQYERQQRCSTAQRPKQSDWQYCCSTARQYGPK